MEEKTTVFNKIKTAILIVLLVICVGAVLAVIDTMKTQSTISNIITVSGFILSFVAVFFFYKPIKYIFNPQKNSDKFLCAVSALLLFSLELSGLINIVKAIFSETTKMPKYWYLYVIGLVVLCLTIVFNRKPKYRIEQLDNMEGHQFEYACADILRANGYKNVVVTQGSGDFGVDVLAEKNGIKYAIQCKCYSHKLDNTPIQEVIGGLVCYGCSKGAVMTNQYFTEPAKELARQNGVELWDRDVIKAMTQKCTKSKKEIIEPEFKQVRTADKRLFNNSVSNATVHTPETDNQSTDKLRYEIYSTLLTDLEKDADIYTEYVEKVAISITTYLCTNDAYVKLEKIDIKFETNEVILEYSLQEQTRVSQIKKHLKNIPEYAGVKYAEYIYPTSTPYTVGIKVPLPDCLEDTSTLIYECNK